MKKNTPNKVEHLLVEEVVAAVKKVKSLGRAQALYKCINEVCTRLEWPVGHAYFPAWNNQTRLEHSNIWFFSNPDRDIVFRGITETTSFDIGAGLPGRVLKTKKPAWIADVTKDTNSPRAKCAQDIGIKAAFAFPVIADSEVVAVLEFFSPLAIEPDEQILEGMENIGKQVGEVIQNQVIADIEYPREIQHKNFINTEWQNSYAQWIKAIRGQVVRLNAYIYCIKHIEEFPFGLFRHNPSSFWSFVVDSMVESSIMVINRILIDKDNDGRNLTLEGLKDKIICHFTDEEYKEQWEKCWDAQWKKIDRNIIKIFKKLRHKCIAHLDRNSNTDVSNESNERRPTFDLTEIREFKININTLFEMLNVGHIFHNPNLYYPLDAKNPIDIEILLDTIAEKSEGMYMPEKDPELWLVYREQFPDSKIEIFNKYREKFNLPPA